MKPASKTTSKAKPTASAAKPAAKPGAKPAAKPAAKAVASKTPAKAPMKPKAGGMSDPFGAMMGGFGGPKKGGKTTFHSALESMNNLMGDLEVIDTKDSKDFLKDKNKKETLLN